jgi:hypothetical protein
VTPENHLKKAHVITWTILGAQVQEFCGFGTREECSRSNTQTTNCDKLHFKKIISIHTDGIISFLQLFVESVACN